MFNRGLVLLIMTGFLNGMVSPCPVQAQEVDDFFYSFGKVVRVEASEIVIAEYDYDREEEVELSFLIDSQTVLENIDSLNKINIGEEIEILYEMINDKSVARRIAKVEALPEEDESWEDIGGLDAPEGNVEAEE